MSGPATIRPYRKSDRSALGQICVATGDSGADASGQFFDDQLLPVVYAYPYAEHSPELCWVVEQEGEVTGYILGVLDVAQYSKWLKANWVPMVQREYPSGEDMDPKSRRLLWTALNPESLIASYRSQYPAEFHVNLLPDSRQQGLGRALVETFVNEVRGQGLPGIAIGVAANNLSALKFYERLGFQPLSEHVVDGKVVGRTLAMTTGEGPSRSRQTPGQ